MTDPVRRADRPLPHCRLAGSAQPGQHDLRRAAGRPGPSARGGPATGEPACAGYLLGSDYRITRNTTRRISVTTIDTAMDPKIPRRLEKNTNIETSPSWRAIRDGHALPVVHVDGRPMIQSRKDEADFGGIDVLYAGRRWRCQAWRSPPWRTRTRAGRRPRGCPAEEAGPSVDPTGGRDVR